MSLKEARQPSTAFCRGTRLKLGQRLGRPRKFKSSDKAVIIRKIKKQPRNSASEINKSRCD